MEISIIEYNRKAIRIGMRMFYVGFLFLFLNTFPFVWESYGMLIVCIALSVMLFGAISVNYYTKKTKKIGLLKFEECCVKILTNEMQIVLINQEYFIKFSNSGYEGKSNYIPFLTIGSLTTNPGVNSICFYNHKNKFELEVLIESKIKYDNLKAIISNGFKI